MKFIKNISVSIKKNNKNKNIKMSAKKILNQSKNKLIGVIGDEV